MVLDSTGNSEVLDSTHDFIDPEEDQRRWDVYDGYSRPDNEENGKTMYEYCCRCIHLCNPDWPKCEFEPWAGVEWEFSQNHDEPICWYCVLSVVWC